MEKYVKDGRVAVLVTKDYGAGWYTNHGEEELVFDKHIVEQVLKGEDIKEYLNMVYKTYNFKYVYYNWAHVPDLEVVWVPENTKFFITEYDGWESVWPINDIPWLEA
jgi:hypothetical protein